MKCPFCNTEMLHGYLHCRGAIWSEKENKYSILPTHKEKYALRLTPLLTSHVESHCCPKCKKLIVDTEDYENNFD